MLARLMSYISVHVVREFQTAYKSSNSIDATSGLSIVEAEYDNVLISQILANYLMNFQFTLYLAPYWALRGEPKLDTWLSNLERYSKVFFTPKLSIIIAFHRGTNAAARGNYAEAMQWYSQGIELAKKFKVGIGNEFIKFAEIFIAIETSTKLSGTQVVSLLENSISLSQSTGEISNQLFAQLILGNFYYRQGELVRASQQLNAVVELTSQSNDFLSLRVAAMDLLAHVLIDERKLDDALSLLYKANILADNHQIVVAQSSILRKIGVIEFSKGNREAARSAFASALPHYVSSENQEGLAVLAVFAGLFDNNKAMFDVAIDLFSELGDRQSFFTAKFYLALSRKQEGMLLEALEIFQEAKEGWQQCGYQEGVELCDAQMEQINIRLSNPDLIRTPDNYPRPPIAPFPPDLNARYHIPLNLPYVPGTETAVTDEEITCPLPSINSGELQKLHAIIVEKLSKEDIHRICYYAGIRLENLPDRNVKRVVAELINHFDKEGKILALFEWLENYKPDFEWQNFFDCTKYYRTK